MPRQRSAGRPAPARPSVAPARPAPVAPQQTRSATTAARPPMQQQAPPAQQSQGPGLFGQMASTAAGVAIGSSVGHAIGGFFSGSGSTPQAEAENAAQAAQTNTYEAPKVCEQNVMQFRQCLDQNGGDLAICGWYLDQLKACQAAAARY